MISKINKKKLKNIAKEENTTVAKIKKSAIDELIEEYHLSKIGEQALKEFKQNPETCSMAELKEMLKI